MEGRVLSHSLASSSGVCRPMPCRSLQQRAALGLRPATPLRLRVAAVAGLSRPDATATSHSLNAPSEEELVAPVHTVSL